MKIKTKDLIGSALDWAVAKCEGNEITFADGTDAAPAGWPSGQWEKYSSRWEVGGPIIEREVITWWPSTPWGGFVACQDMGTRDYYGDTPLIAAMRCYVASKMGDEVDVPDELIERQS